MIGLVLLIVASEAGAKDPGKILADACPAGQDFGASVVCHLTNASMMASLATWKRIMVYLPSIFGLIFALEMLKLMWGWNPETFLQESLTLVMRSVAGLMIATSTVSYTNFLDLYISIEKAALSLVTEASTTVTGTKGGGGGSFQMASLTGILAGYPDSLYGGMTITSQTLNTELKVDVIDCPDFMSDAGLKVLQSYFDPKTGMVALGTARMRCLASSLTEAVGLDSGRAQAFVLEVARLTGRSVATGGVASVQYGTTKQSVLIDMLNAEPNKTPTNIRRMIEDTLFLWTNMDRILNYACVAHGCTTPGAKTGALKAFVKKVDGAFTAVTDIASLGIGALLRNLSDSSKCGAQYILLYIISYLNAIPYYLLSLCAWVIIIALTMAYFRLAIVPAITIPFVLVFYTAWWVTSPIDGQIKRMIGVYKDKIIMYALGPAVVVLLVSIALGLLQGVTAIFVKGVN